MLLLLKVHASFITKRSNVLLCNTNVTVFQFMKWIDGFLGDERNEMEHIDERIKNQKKIADSKPTFDLCDAGEKFIMTVIDTQ